MSIEKAELPGTSSLMPRPKSRRAQASRHKKQKAKSSGTAAGSTLPKGLSNIDVEKLLAKAREHESTGDVANAIAVYEQLLTQKLSGRVSSDVHEELGTLYIQQGDREKAESHLRESIRMCGGNGGFERYMNLAQLLGNCEEALKLTERAIQLLQKDGGQDAEKKEYEASAYCSLAEIGLGIIEESNDPEVAKAMDVQVEQAITSALALSQAGTQGEIEAVLTLANLRLSQGRKDDAQKAMHRVFECLKPSLAKLEQGIGDEDDEIDLPAMEIRIAIGKQLMEVELWNEAVQVHLSIMCECDFNVEVWYMLAICYWKQNEVQQARSALEVTRKVLHSSAGHDGTLDEQMIDRLWTKLDLLEQGDPKAMALADGEGKGPDDCEILEKQQDDTMTD